MNTRHKNNKKHRIECSNRIIIGPYNQDELTRMKQDQAGNDIIRTKKSRSTTSNNHLSIVSPQMNDQSTSATTDYFSLDDTENAPIQVNDTTQGQPAFQGLLKHTPPEIMYTPAENISPSSDNTHITLSENTHNTLSENAHNNLSENTQNTHTTTDTGSSSLLWKKVGDVFITQPNAPVNITQEGTSLVNTHIKRSPILCMRSVSATYDSEPRQYFASKEALFDLLSEKWKQVELVLNPTTLETYTDSSCLWPKKKLEVNVNLTGPSKPERLELFLLSPLDYTFCIRYRSTSRKDPMIVTLTFKARSFIQCQEWYMAIYDRLPATSKHPPPKSCEVYIPLIGISISIPLVHLQKYEEVTIESVKEATLTVLEDAQSEDQAFNQKLARILKADNKQWGLCWTINDRVEWVYWTHSTSIPGKRIDLVVCPQSIEHTHRLELREIEHAPGKILLDDTHLEEPLPVEGYLRRLTDFRGLRHRLFKPKYCYLATFDRYLFYSPSSKVESPNLSCIRKEGFPNDIKYTQSACIVSPFIGQSITEDITSAEIDRRMQLIISSTCMVDLTEVSYITRRFTEDEDQDTNDSRISSHSTSTPMLFRQNNSKKNKPFLEIVMNSGVQIKFECSSAEACDMWVKCLTTISTYWKVKQEAIVAHYSHLESKKEEGEMGKLVPSRSHIKSIADMRAWNYCVYEQCRDIVKSGELYYHPKGRTNYSKKKFILTVNGLMLFYDIYDRRTDRTTSKHDRKGGIDIAGSYIYSGVESGKIKSGSINDKTSKEKLPKIFPNGSTTDDNRVSCVFSIWKPRPKYYFSVKRRRFRVYNNEGHLNSKGESWVFLASSKEEKEQWVWALNSVTEHLIRSRK